MYENAVITAVDKPLPGAYLRGYALIGANLVIGESGRERFGEVRSGQDGAYVSVSPEPGGRVSIGTDDTGYAKLFLYHSGDNWALGASLMELAEYVSDRSWELTVDRSQLQNFLLRGMIGNQLTSHHTVFSEIRLLAPTTDVVVSDGLKPSIEIRRRVDERPSDYANVLQDGLDEVTGLLRTLIQSDIPVVSDITGGRDSRVVLALLQTANSTGQSLGRHVRFRSNRRNSADWPVKSRVVV
ncbi:hypothetical protein [Nesterenkonia alkaliphila]|uniref:Asparagine synthase n=1 Tax=Nesterenkonia alkaliphila TaxID=1463631 RepID=A0A7K1UH81_9MICC|nr:hypothetical protein [Nesterenkonia alkaliphila]MVT25823.1 hypothetical protein [Nesterenkonia alkaliphila]GFZ98571.1 hypothetical protein GCM10011359_29610 [Nesterenkonia alkaliphila]